MQLHWIWIILINSTMVTTSVKSIEDHDFNKGWQWGTDWRATNHTGQAQGTNANSIKVLKDTWGNCMQLKETTSITLATPPNICVKVQLADSFRVLNPRNARVCPSKNSHGMKAFSHDLCKFARNGLNTCIITWLTFAELKGSMSLQGLASIIHYDMS